MQRSAKKVLYITNVNLEGPYLQGVVIKINGQLKAFRKKGFDVDLLSLGNNNNLTFTNGKGDSKLYNGGRSYKPHGFFSKLVNHFRIAWYGSINFSQCTTDLLSNSYDAVYLRFYIPGTDLIKFLRILKAKNPHVKILLEYPTLHAATEFKKRDWPSRITYYLNRRRIKKLNNSADYIVTLTKDKTLFGKPALFMPNGIELESIQPIPVPLFESEVCILGVASDCAFYHGFDKVIKGLSIYKKQKHGINVRFRLITNPLSRHVDYLKDLAKELAVEELVSFEKPMSRNQLSEVYKEVHVGMGTLAMHRIDMSDNFSLKHREYAAFGLPFLMSKGDSFFESSPFVITIERDDDPINIEELVRFYLDLRNRFPDYPVEFRRQVENKISWEHQLGEVFKAISEVNAA